MIKEEFRDWEVKIQKGCGTLKMHYRMIEIDKMKNKKIRIKRRECRWRKE